MKVGHPSRIRVLLVTLIVSTVMVLGQTKRADAYMPGLETVVVAYTVVAVVAAVALVIGVACTAIAVAKASEYPEGFSGAFRDCFNFELNSDQTAPAGENNDASDKPAEEEDEGWDQN